MITHFPLERLAAALRADSFTVNILAGAQGRSARNFAAIGYYRGCQASVAHHTGSSGNNPAGDIAYLLNGKGEGFVIANAYTARDGTITLICSGPNYTEGLGGPRGIIPENRANDVAFSNEIGGGLGAPFPVKQQRAALYLHYHVNRIAAEVWSWPDDPYGPTRLFAHHEWTPRKVDPQGASAWAVGYTMWNMQEFRADAAALDQGDDMTALDTPERAYDSRPTEQGGVNPTLAWANGDVPKKPLAAGETRAIVIHAPITGVAKCRQAHVHITCIGQGNGGVSISGTQVRSFASLVNFDNNDRLESAGAPIGTPEAKVYVTAFAAGCEFIVDVFARG